MGRKRRHEEQEAVIISSDEEGSFDDDEREESDKRRHHRSKKSKKEKRSHRSRSKHSKKHRNRSRSETPEEEDNDLKRRKAIDTSHHNDDSTADDDASTDREGGYTPERNITREVGSDVEDGEISEEEKRHSSKGSRSRRDGKAASKYDSGNLETDATEEEDDDIDKDESHEHKRSRNHRSSRKKEKLSDRERKEESHRRDKRRSQRNHRHSSSDDDQDVRKSRRSKNGTVKSKDRSDNIDDDEALPGDVPMNVKKSESDEEKQNLISGKGDNANTSKEISLSIEESNKLRAKLGLKPLNVTENDSNASKQKKKAELAEKTDKEFAHLEIIPGTEVRHKPADNLTQNLSADKLRDKLKRKREKRKQESKLLAVKSLADSSDEDASSWVLSLKQKQEEKERAKKRAQMFEDLDDDFGIGNLVDKDKKETIKKERNYDSKALAGLKIQHTVDRFEEGKSTILTLQDADILDEDAMDTLENVNVVDQEKAEKNIIEVKKAKQAYNKFDVEDVDEVTGEMSKKNILYKYDEEIDGAQKKSIVIGQGGVYNQDEEDKRRRDEIRKRLHGEKNMVSLNTGALKLASDYMTNDEVSATKFKKIKKKKKVKTKILKADDLIDQLEPNKSHNGAVQSDPYQVMEMEAIPSAATSSRDDDDTSKLTAALQRTRDRLKKLKQSSAQDDAAERVLRMTQTQAPETIKYDKSGAEFIGTFSDDVTTNSNIILNETSEFCRHLGAWRASEASGPTETVPKEILDFEDSLKTDSTREFEKNNKLKEKRGQWEEVTENNGHLPMDLDGDAIKDSGRSKQKSTFADSTILDEEPDMASGVAAALKVAKSKGYLSTQEKEQKSGNLKHLLAKNYSIDDKARDQGDEGGRRGRDRDRGGPSMPFEERKGYIPNIKLEYVDDGGRLMNEKEAFRHLSHKFHGKGSGKIKTEKRMKKIMEESMMKNMSSTDTPLSTLHKLKERQKESSTPYVVLTGNKEQYEQIRK